MCVRAKQEVDKRLDFIIYRLGFESKVQAPTIGDLATSRFFFTAAEIPEILDLWRRHLPDEVERTIEAAERRQYVAPGASPGMSSTCWGFEVSITGQKSIGTSMLFTVHGLRSSAGIGWNA